MFLKFRDINLKIPWHQDVFLCQGQKETDKKSLEQNLLYRKIAPKRCSCGDLFFAFSFFSHDVQFFRLLSHYSVQRSVVHLFLLTVLHKKSIHIYNKYTTLHFNCGFVNGCLNFGNFEEVCPFPFHCYRKLVDLICRVFQDEFSALFEVAHSHGTC